MSKSISVASALGRLTMGIGLFASPRKALAALGFSEAGPQGIAVARIAGGVLVAVLLSGEVGGGRPTPPIVTGAG